jgi:hypothetical protein
MTLQLLQDLTTDEFGARFQCTSNPAAIHHILQRDHDVQEIRTALANGTLTEESLEAFCSKLTRQMKFSERFAHEFALAAIAVSLETRQTEFAKRFVRGLANLAIAEIPVAIRVAKHAAKVQSDCSDTYVRTFSYRNVPTIQNWMLMENSPPTSSGEQNEVFVMETR